MLKSLSIQNYALIDELEIEFQKGFSTLTGETGAGKSILLGALSLIIGNRADSSVLRDKDRKCIVEATVDISAYKLKALFEEHDVDYEKETVIRRQITENGKSRAFVNDQPVNLGFLKELGEHLIDIHSQHQTMILANPEFHLNVLDAFAIENGDLNVYQEKYQLFRKKTRELNNLKEKLAALQQERDFVQFQFEELEKAKLQTNELEELEQEQSTLIHAESIKAAFQDTDIALQAEENSVLQLVKDLSKSMEKIASQYPKASDFSNRLESAYYELKDIAEESAQISESIDISPDRLEEVNQRLDMLFHLQQKHKVSGIADLIVLRDQFKTKIDLLEDSGFQIDELEKEIDKLHKELDKFAKQLSTKRKKEIPGLEKRISDLLKSLGMPSASFVVKQDILGDFAKSGKDQIQFLFSANKAMPPQELSKVASGGEMSRVMLTLKSLIASKTTLPTLILDEIDTGVSGEIADKMGNMMRDISEDLQLITITHLPQVASKGNFQYLVYKHESDATYSNIKLLNENERVSEIAKMLSGEDISEAARSNALELLKK